MNPTQNLSRREALTAAALGWLAWPTPAPAQDPAPTATPLRTRTVVFVRHAEKDPDDADKVDPGLAERGRARAEKLAGMLASAGVTAAYATAFRRTRQTLAPLATKAGITIEDYDARTSVQFATSLTAAPEGPPGPQTIVVAAHSNTLPQMVQALGGRLQGLNEKGWLADDDYERLVVVTLCAPAGQALQAVATVDLRLQL